MANILAWTRSLTVAALLTAFFAPFAPATTVRIVNMVEMVERADRVFWGQCLSATPLEDASHVLPVIEYVFRVREGIKGVQTGETVVFRQVRAGQRGVVGIAGMPEYRKGQEVLLFLHPDSRSGLTSPVGFSQGTFTLQRDPQGDVHAANPLENQNLAYRLSAERARAAGITEQELQLMQSGRPLPVRLFSSLVDRIDRHHDSKGRPLQ